jgi:penicillin-binding protein 1A
MRRRDLVIIVTVLTALIAVSVLSAVWLLRHGWAIHQLTRGVGDTTFYTADGRPWFTMDEHRRDVPLDAIAPSFRDAVIAVEDHRFRFHWGIDPIGLTRSVVQNIRAGGIEEGGSTITQQLARTLFLSNSRTWGRKFKEGVLALMIEKRLSKDQILELYVNRVYLGAGVYGVEKMSQQLFDKPARRLTLAESALIAGLIRRPSGLSPWSNMSGARARSHVVLRRMREEGLISAEDEAAARGARLSIQPHPRTVRAEAGYAKEYLRNRFRQEFDGDHPPDWKVFTTFSPAIQAEAERAVRGGLARLGRRDLQAALVALRPETGELVALVGGREFNQSTFDRSTRSRRQPGSAFKPFVYAAALERGFSPVTPLAQPEQIAISGMGDWRPRNSSLSSRDEIPLREAIIESNNRAAVGVQQQIGSRPVLSLAHTLGLEDLPDVASLALGTGLVTPLELTAAYAAFANGGYAIQPVGIRRVADAQGATVFEEDAGMRRAISEQTAFQMVTLLEDVIDRGTGTSARVRGVRFPAAGKTGTTNDYNDAWFVGFTSSLVVGVWVGYDTPASMGPNASGANYALPIWSEFMVRAARAFPPRRFAIPDGMQAEVLCRESYQRPTNFCPTYREYFKEDDRIPSDVCEIHRGPTRAERVRTAIEGWLGKLKGIFRW